jgi:hypothetical protein
MELELNVKKHSTQRGGHFLSAVSSTEEYGAAAEDGLQAAVEELWRPSTHTLTYLNRSTTRCFVVEEFSDDGCRIIMKVAGRGQERAHTLHKEGPTDQELRALAFAQKVVGFDLADWLKGVFPDDTDCSPTDVVSGELIIGDEPLQGFIEVQTPLI